MTTVMELVPLVLACYLCAAVLLGACVLGSWLEDQAARRRDGGA